MSEPTALMVPVHVDALVVNDQVRRGQNFQRWQANYALLRHRLPPEPPPFAGIDTEFAVLPERGGVYLQWQLPQALTHGHQAHPEADITFPLVPNRWLVVRTHGPSAADTRERTAWIVESDHLDPATGTSPYITRDGQITRIGRRIALADEAWTEPGAPDGGLFLTVVGPGLATFAAYQPYNTDVFSLHDTMDGLDDDREHSVSYFVAGWYSDPSADPVAGLTTEQLKTLLTTYDWTLAEGCDGPATRLLCHGTVLSLTWHRTGPMPPSPRPDIVNAAVGNTTAHATGALPKGSEPDDAQGPWSPAALLGALQHGQLDEAEGPFAQARRTFASWFTPAPSGYTWVLEEAQDAPQGSRSERRAARRSLTGLLDRLNSAQAAHDAAAQDLATARRRLYDLWWAQGMPETPMLLPGRNQPEPGAYREQLNQQLAAAEQDAAGREEALRQARARIPWGMTADELSASVQEYLGDAAPGYMLKRAPLPDLHRPNEPVVILRGTRADQQIRSKADEALRCRRPAELVTGVYLDAEHTHLVAAPASAVPIPPNLPHSPQELRPLLGEFFHLDPAGAAELADAAGVPEELVADLRAAMADPQGQACGVAPAHGTAPWSQPWSPLFFQWEVDYYPIAFADSGSAHAPQDANWTFDGNGYRWTGQGGVADPLTLRGRQFLTPAPAQQQEDGLRRLAEDHSGPYREQLLALAALAGEGDLIAQTLDGFQDQLCARSVNNALETDGSSRVRSSAVDEQAALIRPPALGSLPHPFVLWPPSRFQEVRSGQFAFYRLSIVDRFGRALPVVIPDELQLREGSIGNGTPAHAFRPWIADELCPGLDENGHPITVVTQDAGRFVEVKPRLPQPARTRFHPLSATDDDTPADGDHAGAALCGWLIPNHLDRTLLCYGPDGTALGAVDTTVTTAGATRPAWLPLPGSSYDRPVDLAEDHPHLHDLVDALLARDPRTLVTLLRALDRALTTIAPNGDQTPGTTLGRLIGRPLALVRACVRIDLDGPAQYDPSWRNLLNPAPSALPDYRWPVRLGERDDLDDGLLGYFQERGYGTLHTVLDAEDLSDLDDPDDYLQPIAAGYGLSLPAREPRDHGTASSARLTLLVDPYGVVNATTGILPTAHLRLPGRAFEEPLEALAAAFRFGPMPLLPVPGEQEPALPRPSDRHGTWSWQQRSPAGAWQGLPTRPITPDPHFPSPSPQLRTGWLQLHPAAPEEDHA
ncbi:hypothetical protein ACFY0R_09840 [Streptomyces sp. NPDC001633]|uniref:hypothetical protein n=1 Tax=Streptomyces sp. NPDC001633 TaxID=3364595 RepID=UPI00369E6AB2